jgi:transcriptional regulator of met regulon
MNDILQKWFQQKLMQEQQLKSLTNQPVMDDEDAVQREAQYDLASKQLELIKEFINDLQHHV